MLTAAANRTSENAPTQARSYCKRLVWVQSFLDFSWYEGVLDIRTNEDRSDTLLLTFSGKGTGRKCGILPFSCQPRLVSAELLHLSRPKFYLQQISLASWSLADAILKCSSTPCPLFFLFYCRRDELAGFPLNLERFNKGYVNHCHI